MKKPKKPESFIIKPTYPGGRKAMAEFIRQNLKYPEDALANKVQGTVVVTIEINHKGDVIRTRIKQGLGHGCDEEAQRIAQLLKFDAKRHKGVKVTFKKTLNINFRLQPAKPKQNQGGISFKYTITPSEKSGTSYTYSIGRKESGKIG